MCPKDSICSLTNMSVHSRDVKKKQQPWRCNRVSAQCILSYEMHEGIKACLHVINTHALLHEDDKRHAYYVESAKKQHL